MSELANAGDAGGEMGSVASMPETGEGLSVAEAMAALQNRRYPDEKDEAAQESADDATEQPEELADEANAAPQETEATGETQEADPAEQPSLELPRSWSRDKAEVWSKLDRATQEYLLEHDSKASAEVRRSQNEAAEQRKAIDAERQKVEQARVQYEQALPALLQTLQDQQAGEFADVKTVDDVNRLAKEDPFRYLQWDAHQKRMQAVQMQVTASEQRQSQEKATKWQEFLSRENDLAKDSIPELADNAKAEPIKNEVAGLLRNVGFKPEELNGFVSGEKISPFDHRMQVLLYKAAKYDMAQKSVKTVTSAPKPVPPVQRPGVAQARATAADAEIQALQKRFEQSGNPRDAAILLAARRAARRA